MTVFWGFSRGPLQAAPLFQTQEEGEEEQEEEAAEEGGEAKAEDAAENAFWGCLLRPRGQLGHTRAGTPTILPAYRRAIAEQMR